MGLATLCQLLDEMPSMGVGQQSEGIGGPSEEDADEVLLAAGPVVVYRRGGWASRFTTLPLLAAGLDDGAAGVWLSRTGVRGQLRPVAGDPGPR